MASIILFPSLFKTRCLYDNTQVSNSTPTPYSSAHINYLIKNKSRGTHIFRFAPTASCHHKHYENSTVHVFAQLQPNVLHLIFTITTEGCVFRYLSRYASCYCAYNRIIEPQPNRITASFDQMQFLFMKHYHSTILILLLA